MFIHVKHNLYKLVNLKVLHYLVQIVEAFLTERTLVIKSNGIPSHWLRQNVFTQLEKQILDEFDIKLKGLTLMLDKVPKFLGFFWTPS